MCFSPLCVVPLSHNAQEQGQLDGVELGSTATVIEGKLRDVLETVAKVTEAQLHHDPRVMMTIQLDVYPGQQVLSCPPHLS